jgi:prepilin-type N-terminal cleavage/methylation domain-containing protein
VTFTTNNKYNRGSQQGFSLVEISLVVLIIGILSVGGFNIFKLKREQALYGASVEKLVQLKKSIISYSLFNGHMPCPDIDGDGLEDRTGDACAGTAGVAPYLDLDLSLSDAKDSWSNLIIYSINNEANSTFVSDSSKSASYFDGISSAGDKSLTFKLSTPPTMLDSGTGNLQVLNSTAGDIWADNPIAVLVAYNSNRMPCDDASVSEQENCDGDEVFHHYPLLLSNDAAVFFDDSLMAISATEVKSAILKLHPSYIKH